MSMILTARIYVVLAIKRALKGINIDYPIDKGITALIGLPLYGQILLLLNGWNDLFMQQSGGTSMGQLHDDHLLKKSWNNNETFRYSIIEMSSTGLRVVDPDKRLSRGEKV